MNHPTEVRAGRAPVRGNRRDGHFRCRGGCHHPDSQYEGKPATVTTTRRTIGPPLLTPPYPQFPSGVAGRATATRDGLRPLPRLSITSHTRTSAKRSGRCLLVTELVVHRPNVPLGGTPRDPSLPPTTRRSAPRPSPSGSGELRLPPVRAGSGPPGAAPPSLPSHFRSCRRQDSKLINLWRMFLGPIPIPVEILSVVNGVTRFPTG